MALTGQTHPDPVEGMVWRARAIGDEGHGQRLPSWQSPPRPAGVGGAETGGLCWGELGDAESMHPPAPRGRQPGRPWGRVGGASSPHGGLPRGALGRGVSLEGRGRAWGSSVTGTLWGLLGGTHSCPQAGGSEGLCLPSCPPRPSDPRARVHGGSGTHRPGSHTGPPSSGLCPGSLIGKTSDRPESAPRGAGGLLACLPASPCGLRAPCKACVWVTRLRAGAALMGSLTGRCRGAEPPGR